jgi:hypothetical protein
MLILVSNFFLTVSNFFLTVSNFFLTVSNFFLTVSNFFLTVSNLKPCRLLWIDRWSYISRSTHNFGNGWRVHENGHKLNGWNVLGPDLLVEKTLIVYQAQTQKIGYETGFERKNLCLCQRTQNVFVFSERSHYIT